MNLIDIYLINKLLYNLKLVQVQQYTKSNHEGHKVAPLSKNPVLNVADRACIQPQFPPENTH